MQQDTITFQLATHYLPKIALRLECLFLTIQQACDETHPVIHHYALKNILEITKLIEKPELKSRFLKELMRIEHMLNKSEQKIPDSLFDHLYAQVQFLSHITGRFGEPLLKNSFLQAIRLAEAGDQFECELYSPNLLLWLESEASTRQEQLEQWLRALKPLCDTVSVYLALLRKTTSFKTIDLVNGFYQQPLPARNTCHLILLRMDKSNGLVPKMQLGHHGLSLRVNAQETTAKPEHFQIEVDLGICQL